MKKKYEKPVIFIESFELSQHIAECGLSGDGAGSSLGKPLHSWAASCAWKDAGGRHLFTELMGNCKKKVQEGTQGGYCYNTPTPQMKVFGS